MAIRQQPAGGRPDESRRADPSVYWITDISGRTKTRLDTGLRLKGESVHSIDIVRIESYSHNHGENILREKGLLREIHQMPEIWAKYPGQAQYSQLSEALEQLGGWSTEVQVDLGPEDRSHNERLTPFLDAYHPDHRVAIEHEKKEQMRARWHLMKMQAAHERDQTLGIDIGVLIYPTNRDPSLRRTRRELEGPFFSEYFPIHLPIYAIEYFEEEDS